MEENIEDKFLICKDCKRKFLFSIREQKQFGQKGWANPVRCKVCRRMKKILNLALEENVSISDEVQFSEVCDKCNRKFYTRIKRKTGINIYCDDCWEEIKRGDLNAENGKKDEGMAKS